MARLMPAQFKCNTCGGFHCDRGQDGIIYFHVCPPLAPDKNGILTHRPDYRDENLVQHKLSLQVTITAEGKGVKCLTNASLIEPQWITAVKARFPADTEDE